MASVTRAEIMDRYGLGRSTLEKWFRERASTGHPEPDGRRGQQLTWDAGAWHAWYSARGTEAAVPDGLATRDRLAEIHGLSRHALKELWAARGANGHPEPARRHGKALYWDTEEWAAWYGSLPAEHDRELLTLAEAGRLLGLAPGTVTVYASRPPKGWPEPVEEVPLGGGRTRRLYRRADVLAYAAGKA
ncbi:hypothetical protein [Actinocorallia populi]|uniref:hypothetical protein n=1 Tax=Actinocorallia populi TaxID=2079200 RepID=UPI001E5D9261|nr:hypothetical protein [Actinocorallia populi]